MPRKSDIHKTVVLMGTCHFLVSNGTQEAGYFMVLEIRFSIHFFAIAGSPKKALKVEFGRQITSISLIRPPVTEPF